MTKKPAPPTLDQLTAQAIIDIVACEHGTIDGVLVYVSYRDPEGETFLLLDQYGNEHTIKGMRSAIEDDDDRTMVGECKSVDDQDDE